MKKYLFSYDEEIENMINSIIVKRALKNKNKIEKMADLLRNIIKEEYERKL
jgi:hypothetical protein